MPLSWDSGGFPAWFLFDIRFDVARLVFARTIVGFLSEVVSVGS